MTELECARETLYEYSSDVEGLIGKACADCGKLFPATTEEKMEWEEKQKIYISKSMV